MKTKIVQIGNSRGIRIPKALLQQSGLNGAVRLEVQWQKIIMQPAHKLRQGWAEAFRMMAKNNDDRLLDKGPVMNLSSWDDRGWIW